FTPGFQILGFQPRGTFRWARNGIWGGPAGPPYLDGLRPGGAHLVDDFSEGVEVAGFLDEGVEAVLAVAAGDFLDFVAAGEDDFEVGTDFSDFAQGVAAI